MRCAIAFIFLISICASAAFCEEIDPIQVALPGATQPSPAQEWLADIPRDNQGFASFAPAGPSIHIAPAGNDAGDGSENSPIASFKRAEQLIKDGQGASVLFQRGGTYEINDSIQSSGKNPRNLLLIGAYGDPAKARPIITNQITIGGRDPEYHFIALQSLDIQKTNYNGIRAYLGGSYLWIEDCRVSNCPADGIMLQSKGNLSTVILRRNTIVDCMQGDKCQGVYASGIHDLIIDGNFADHNGWHAAADKTIFSHDFYLQFDNDPIIFTNNFCSNAASHGVQQRSGGVNRGNYYYRNPLACYVCKNKSDIEGNVIEGGAAISDKLPRGQGLEISGCDATASGNLFIDKADPFNAMSAIDVNLIFDGKPNLNMHVTLRNNVVWHWTGEGLHVNSPIAQLEESNDDLDGTGDYIDPSRNLENYAKSIGLADADGLIKAMRENCRGPNYDARLTAASAAGFVRRGFEFR